MWLIKTSYNSGLLERGSLSEVITLSAHLVFISHTILFQCLWWLSYLMDILCLSGFSMYYVSSRRRRRPVHEYWTWLRNIILQCLRGSSDEFGMSRLSCKNFVTAAFWQHFLSPIGVGQGVQSWIFIIQSDLLPEGILSPSTQHFLWP